VQWRAIGEGAETFIARDLITVSQYQHFIDDGGYERQELWTEQGWAWLTAFRKHVDVSQIMNLRARRPKSQMRQRTDQPITNVNRHEAEAYCAWLNSKLGARGVDAEDRWRVRLPSIYEWTQAARETDPQTWARAYATGRADALTILATFEYCAPVSITSLVGDGGGNLREWVFDQRDDCGTTMRYRIDSVDTRQMAVERNEFEAGYLGQEIGFRVMLTMGAD
jgi:formylglycine-generating enzyme required for sulfatase activity